METLIALAAGALLIALGMRLIHRLNAQHDERIAAHHFSDPYPAIIRPPGHSHHPSTGQASRRRVTGTWP
ncbi:hypothetical protein Q5762_22525 [Streptomyces sp. P9(2023)]|uniref:hypothetical protein n=1 Tax=Streptomyces sp. P9(2023) TaxID=3064394 RepID=UPI0028F437A1|nr:hypothetical protein [Streptomyces sp. P9(2023)]MDT9691073.1 hypothetical protein [Streptomyces sp. P9(2023)]